MTGGGGGHTTATTYTSSLPEYAEPYYEDLLSRTAAESQGAYIPYEGERLAGFDPASEQAFGQVTDIAGRPLTGIEDAAGTARDLSGYQAGPITTQSMEGYDLSGYMDPYVQQTLDVQNRMAQQRFMEQQAGRSAEAVQAGAFGGTRGAVQESLALRDMNEQLQAREAQAMQAAYGQAQQAFTSDQARALQAAQAQEQARLAGAGMQLQGSQQLAGLDQLRQQMGLESAQALGGVGAQRQAQEQRGLDIALEDFINQRDFQRQQLSFYSGILQGTPVTPQSEVVQSQPSPSMASQLVGAGTAATGLQGLVQ